MRWKVPLYVVGGLLFIATTRKPDAVKRITQRDMAGAFLVQGVRKAVSALR